ncbi:MAG: bifunctional diaminohydroxyphosphoribosylaminopyrimidine deaminase/5-amino-6-(5-phosphoribosylamino)uracil reductase RibD [Methylophilaceae bacterium]
MTEFTPDDHLYMTQALRLAEQGLYTSMPNPRVGCVIVKDGVVVGEGAHIKAGTPHAEVHALKQAGQKAKGATAYATLEPCSHHGCTAPCADALVKAGLDKVIIAMQDPNPLVSGQGIALIESAGITVQTGLMQPQAQALNTGFISRMTKQLPLVRSKIAASLDGKTALSNGESKWITSAAARSDVQHWRARSCAMMTGIGTILSDNPSLTVREHNIERQPVSVIVDSQLRIPLDAKVLQNPEVLIAFATDTANKAEQLAAIGISLLCIPNEQGKVCLQSLLSHLASNEVNEVMVEGGDGLNGALMALKCIDELVIYYAPKLMGSDGKGMFAIPTLQSMQDVVDLSVIEVRQFGDDIRVLARCES